MQWMGVQADIFGRLSACTLALWLTVSEGSQKVCGHSLIHYGADTRSSLCIRIVAARMCIAEVLCKLQRFEQTYKPFYPKEAATVPVQIDEDPLSVIL